MPRVLVEEDRRGDAQSSNDQRNPLSAQLALGRGRS